MPGKLVFGRDIRLWISHVANWHQIKKEKKINYAKDNTKEINHTFQLRTKVLVERHFTRN